MSQPDDSTPEFFTDGVFFQSLFRRTPEEWQGLIAAERIKTMSPPRRQRKPTLERVAKQATKAGIAVARYELKPDGTVVFVPGTPEPPTESNPWLADLRRKERR